MVGLLPFESLGGVFQQNFSGSGRLHSPKNGHSCINALRSSTLFVEDWTPAFAGERTAALLNFYTQAACPL
jgi:hypothetical protein